MKGIIAQSGLQFSIDIVFKVKLESNEYRWFQRLFGNLVNYNNEVTEKGIIISFILNINEEISRMGRFKDVPSKTEVKRYMPLIMASDTYLKSDIEFIKNVNYYYIEKEQAKGRKLPKETVILYEKVKKSIEEADIKINNLVLSKHKKP
ncbi:hypothetical protein [Alkaliphilus peptidifermentans]|uniref:Uncharacterized protein n=1 Tax=Alkaliphilus peptidifermentans DSM 18978 TaxID=1120976 RepID=A0A1G5BZP5_9FIRM|nr:hypothetical protein [Alkaliphilus peptidifermentans]SCX95603.1 hypothetical protein SAMN03080606_00573 [Alkaliphilus peptidifermentans DSM 18978]